MELSLMHVLRVGRVRPELSLGTELSLPAKDVTNPDQTTSHGRLDARQHLSRLVGCGRIDKNHPVLLLSVRNVLSNLRSIAYTTPLTDPLSVDCEVFCEHRPYHILGWTSSGQFELKEFI